MQRFNMLPLGYAVLATTLLSGCASYQPQTIELDTIDSAWADRALVVPAMEDLANRLGQAAPTHDDGLTLNEAEIVALFGNPELRLARLEAGVELAAAKESGLLDDPEFGFDLMRNVDTGSDPWIYGLSLGFTIPLSGRLDVERDQAWAGYRAAWHDVVIDEWELLRQLRQDWVAWSSTINQIVVLTFYTHDLDALIATANSLVEVGELAAAEARLLEIERAQRRIEIARLQSQAMQQRRSLIATMGLRPDTQVELVTEGSVHEVTLDLQRTSTPTHPRVLAALANYEIAEQALHREIVKQYPDLTIGPAFENEEGQSRIGFGFGIPLPIFNANRQGIAEATAQRESAKAQVELAYQQASVELAQAEARFEDALSLQQILADELLPLTAKQVDEARALLEIGEVDLLLLAQAVTAGVDAKLAVIEYQTDVMAAALDYQALTNPRWATEPEMREENE